MPITHLRRLGETDLEVSPIGLGVMQFAGGSAFLRVMYDKLSQVDMNVIIEAGLQGGINWFDTAEIYGWGRSERGLTTALRAAGRTDDKVIIGSKWFPLLRTARNIPRTIEDRLRHLQGYSLDLYLVHQPWGFSSPEAEMQAMADLVETGKIRSIGVSNFNADQMQRAHAALKVRGLPLAVNQVQYSLLHRKIETNGVLDMAKELGVTIVAYTPLGSGLLSGIFHQDPNRLNRLPFFRKARIHRRLETSRPVVAALEDLAQKYQVTPAQIALNWLIHFQGETVVAIPGASKVLHARDAVGAMRFRLTSEEMSRLDMLTRVFR